MNCCDEYGDCRQGRDCPVRMRPAKVARVGRKDYDREPLPPSVWPSVAKRFAAWFLQGVIVLFVMAGAVVSVALMIGEKA
jgi:hypothetical protein